MAGPNISLKELRRVVLAAAVGNVIEWYDFYIFGSLASILAVKFFEKGHPVAAFLSTVALFSVGSVGVTGQAQVDASGRFHDANGLVVVEGANNSITPLKISAGTTLPGTLGSREIFILLA